MDWSCNDIEILEKLNNLLWEKQQLIKDKLSFYQKLVQDRGVEFYDVEANVEFYSGEEQLYESLTVSFSDNMFMEDINWYEHGAIFPKLKREYCYLMHQLCYHTELYEKILTIDCVWVNVQIREQEKVEFKYLKAT